MSNAPYLYEIAHEQTRRARNTHIQHPPTRPHHRREHTYIPHCYCTDVYMHSGVWRVEIFADRLAGTSWPNDFYVRYVHPRKRILVYIVRTLSRCNTYVYIITLSYHRPAARIKIVRWPNVRASVREGPRFSSTRTVITRVCAPGVRRTGRTPVSIFVCTKSPELRQRNHVNPRLHSVSSWWNYTRIRYWFSVCT